MKAQLIAMKDKNYSLQEIHSAARQLLDPAKRLAADFMYPTKVKAKRPQKITINFEVPEYNLNEIDDNSFDSLK